MPQNWPSVSTVIASVKVLAVVYEMLPRNMRRTKQIKAGLLSKEPWQSPSHCPPSHDMLIDAIISHTIVHYHEKIKCFPWSYISCNIFIYFVHKHEDTNTLFIFELANGTTISNMQAVVNSIPYIILIFSIEICDLLCRASTPTK